MLAVVLIVDKKAFFPNTCLFWKVIYLLSLINRQRYIQNLKSCNKWWNWTSLLIKIYILLNILQISVNAEIKYK